MSMGLGIATIVLAGAVALGTYLALWRAGSPSLRLGLAHGTLGIAGWAVLLYLVPGSHRGEATGSQSFGVIAAVLLAAAVLVGVSMLALRLRARAVPGGVIGVHATLAVSGFVILAVYAMLG